MRLALGLACAVYLLLLGGCRTSSPPVRACTLIGCSDGITVVVQNAPATPYTVEVTREDGTRRTARCEAAGGCGAGLLFEGISDARVTIRVIIGDAGASSSVVRPGYVESRPNGPGCPPTCRHARVQVTYAP